MKVAVLGATGLVGRTMLRLLADRDWVRTPPLALSSTRGAGTDLPFRGGTVSCRTVTGEAFAGIDVALFSAGADPSRRWAPLAAAAGVTVIDNSSAWRMAPDVPLVVPEINGSLVSEPRPGIIANPNCSTIQIAMAVAPLQRTFGLREVHATTLQAVSGAGQPAVEELSRQLAADCATDGQAAAGSDASDGPFPRRMAGNAIPAIGAALEDGSYEEEAKVGRELRKILSCGENLAVSCTATRVPVVSGHCAALRIVCDAPVDPAAAVRVLSAWPGVEVAAAPHDYLTPREVAGRTCVHVGRIRRDPTDPRGLLCWVVADNLLKGAAWNAVQIADLVAGDAPE